MDAGTAMGIDAALVRLMTATAPFDAGRALLNFAEKPQRAERPFGDAALRRLRAVKDRVDGDDLFAANHPVNSSRAS